MCHFPRPGHDWRGAHCILIPPGLGNPPTVSSLVPTDAYIIWEIYGRSVVRAFAVLTLGPAWVVPNSTSTSRQAVEDYSPQAVCVIVAFSKWKKLCRHACSRSGPETTSSLRLYAIIFVHPFQGWNTLIFQNPLAGFGALLSSDPVWVPTWTDSWYDLMTAWESGWVGLILGNLGLGLTVLKKVLERGSCLAEATVSQFSTL
jgi:hypothetical protein